MLLFLDRCQPQSGCTVWRGIWVLFHFFFFFLSFFFNFTILYWFCQILKWIRHRYTCVPHPEPSSLLPPYTIPLGHPSAPTPSIQYHASNLDWRLVSYMILYMFQCHSPKSSHPLHLPQSPKDCSIHQCLFYYRGIFGQCENLVTVHVNPAWTGIGKKSRILLYYEDYSNNNNSF